MKKVLKIILNILTCLTLFFGMLIVSILIDNKTPINSMEGLYFGLNVIWVFLLFLPISITNILYGLYLKKEKYKYKSNFILGIIFSVLLTGYGSMHFLNKGIYSEDKRYLYNLEQTMDINLPDDFSILTVDWSKEKQTSSSNIYLKYVSVVRLNGNIDLSFTNEWITNVENQKDHVPITFYYETMNYEKFLIYCFDSKEFNPSNFNYEFDYVVIGYDHENNNLLIYEYYFKK